MSQGHACGACRTVNAPGSAFCRNCGAGMVYAAPPPQQIHVQQPGCASGLIAGTGLGIGLGCIAPMVMLVLAGIACVAMLGGCLSMFAGGGAR